MFTDEMLEKWKGLTPGSHVPPLWEAKALLARLEAAERYISSSHNDDSGTMSICIRPCERCEALEQWRKAKGEI